MDISKFNLITESECSRLYYQQKKLINEFYETKDYTYLVRIAILLTLSPICDYLECIKILKELCKRYYDINVYIIGAYIMNEWFIGEDNYFIEVLKEHLIKTNDTETLAIIYYLIGKSFEKNNSNIIAKKYYEKSIEFSPALVNNYVALSKLVETNEKNKLLEIAKKNVVKIITEYEIDNISLDELCNERMFIQEYIMGINITECVFNVVFENQSLSKTGDG